MNDIELLKTTCQLLKQTNEQVLQTQKDCKEIYKSYTNDYQLVKNLEPKLKIMLNQINCLIQESEMKAAKIDVPLELVNILDNWKENSDYVLENKRNLDILGVDLKKTASHHAFARECMIEKVKELFDEKNPEKSNGNHAQEQNKKEMIYCFSQIL